jgi:hypothetical protein
MNDDDCFHCGAPASKVCAMCMQPLCIDCGRDGLCPDDRQLLADFGSDVPLSP